MSNKTIQLPTHFRFRKRKEAEQWGVTTKDWNPIKEIHVESDYINISTFEFAWVYYNRKKDTLEFTVRACVKCKICNNVIVTNKKDICEECFYDIY